MAHGSNYKLKNILTSSIFQGARDLKIFTIVLDNQFYI